MLHFLQPMEWYSDINNINSNVLIKEKLSYPVLSYDLYALKITTVMQKIVNF